MARAEFNKMILFHRQIRLEFQEESSKVLHLEHSVCMVLKLGDISESRSVIAGQF
jgi:hypothetical protein